MKIHKINKKIILVFSSGLLVASYIGNNISINSNDYTEIEESDTILVKLDNRGVKEEIELEEYIKGVVAAEMPLSFHIEALKAQAIAARTYTLKRILHNKELTNSTLNQVYLSKSERKKKFLLNYNKYEKLLNDVVNDTRGIYITHNDVVIDALYYSSNCGYSQSALSYYGNDLPYLKSVTSSFEETLNNEHKYTFSIEEFKELLDINEKNIDITKSNIPYPNIFKINDNDYSNIYIMKRLKLRSPTFNITLDQNKINIVTKGYGHGVGMSQYGSNILAKKNFKYEEIIKYYYTDVKLDRLI